MTTELEDDRWETASTPKANEPDAVSRTLGNMASQYRKNKAALFSRKSLRVLRNEFEECLEHVEALTDDERADANALLHSAIEKGSFIEILRSVRNIGKPNKK
ncbi:hypothetical protein MCEMRE217_00241 [Candidatus Nanopelagicaceae bacterium]